MFVRTSLDSENQEAAKITSALAESRIYSFMKMMTLYMCIDINIFLNVLPSSSSSVVAMSASRPAGVCRNYRFKKNAAERAERIKNYYYESLPFSRQCQRGYETIKDSQRQLITKPDTMRLSKSYQKTTQGSRLTLLIFQSQK